MTARISSGDLRDGQLIVTVESQSEAGFWFLDRTPVLLDASVTPGELAAAVRGALNRSRTSIPTPPHDAELTRELLAMAGTRSYVDYMRGTKSVQVWAEETDSIETVELTPQRSGGGSRGFTLISASASAIKFTYDSPGQIGRAVFEALTKSV